MRQTTQRQSIMIRNMNESCQFFGVRLYSLERSTPAKEVEEDDEEDHKKCRVWCGEKESAMVTTPLRCYYIKYAANAYIAGRATACYSTSTTRSTHTHTHTHASHTRIGSGARGHNVNRVKISISHVHCWCIVALPLPLPLPLLSSLAQNLYGMQHG